MLSRENAESTLSQATVRRAVRADASQILQLVSKYAAQGLMLPFLALAALYFRYRRTEAALRPGLTWTLCLWFAALAMSAVGIYQLLTAIQKALG